MQPQLSTDAALQFGATMNLINTQQTMNPRE